MLTRLRVKNLKRFDDVDIELGQSVVLIGPNDSGKTTALQALALWDVGRRRWEAGPRADDSQEEKVGVTINRRDLISIPVPEAKLLWRDLRVSGTRGGAPGDVLIEITVDGIRDGKPWVFPVEFEYANEESLYCRSPLLQRNIAQRNATVKAAASVRVAFLPPMSGLAATEPKWEPGRINVLIGEGQTAQVLRNLCHQIYESDERRERWTTLTAHIEKLFGVTLSVPDHDAERGEITMTYEERGAALDLSSSGRGLQQTLLLLAHLYANPGSVLLFDEPDAHLEILRQRETYRLINEVAREQGSQVIAASHSEVVLEEAAQRDVVIAFVGRPHRINDRGSQVVKALKDIGYRDYYQAEQQGWVLYLEGSTDLAILQAFAETANHDARRELERPFVHYVGGPNPGAVLSHFWGLREAKPDLVGVALFDRRSGELPKEFDPQCLTGLQWRKREIENYLCYEEVLLRYARGERGEDLLANAEATGREEVMRQAIEAMTGSLETQRRPGPWSDDIKASDDFLEPLFENYFEALGLPNLLRKSGYHELARLVPRELIDDEVTEKLDAIVAVAKQAKPRT